MAAILVMIDGLRPDAIAAAGCTYLPQLIERGAASLVARSVTPSITLPCHMSIFHSVPPARHGLVSNDWTPMARPLPGLIEVAKAAEKRCAFFYNWEPLRNLSVPGGLYLSYFRHTEFEVEGDLGTVEMAARCLKEDAPDFLFVYLGTTDTAGHSYGWMEPGYLAQVRRVDGYLPMLVDAMTDADTLLVQADHGGHERNHGLDIAEDRTIPWILMGPGIKRGYTIAGPVSLLDTAPTLARVLGLKPNAQWEGWCVEEAFEPSAISGQFPEKD